MSAIDVRRRLQRLETDTAPPHRMNVAVWTEADMARFDMNDYTDDELISIIGQVQLAEEWPTMTEAERDAALQEIAQNLQAIAQERPA